LKFIITLRHSAPRWPAVELSNMLFTQFLMFVLHIKIQNISSFLLDAHVQIMINITWISPQKKLFLQY
jgi:hypothetical protein